MWVMMALAGAGTTEPGPISVELPKVLLRQGDDLRSVVDNGASATISGGSWRTILEKKLQEDDLHPTKEEALQVFRGLGDARRVAEACWTVPVGIGGRHTTQRYLAIDGDMIGLTSRKDLERWGTNLYIHNGTTTAAFEELKVYSKVLPPRGNGRATLDFHPHHVYTGRALPHQPHAGRLPQQAGPQPRLRPRLMDRRHPAPRTSRYHPETRRLRDQQAAEAHGGHGHQLPRRWRHFRLGARVPVAHRDVHRHSRRTLADGPTEPNFGFDVFGPKVRQRCLDMVRQYQQALVVVCPSLSTLCDANSKNANYEASTDVTERCLTASGFINATVRIQTAGSRFAVATADVGCPDLELIDVDEQHGGLHDKSGKVISQRYIVAVKLGSRLWYCVDRAGGQQCENKPRLTYNRGHSTHLGDGAKHTTVSRLLQLHAADIQVMTLQSHGRLPVSEDATRRIVILIITDGILADYLDVFHWYDDFDQHDFNAKTLPDGVILCVFVRRSALRWSYPVIRADTGVTHVFPGADDPDADREQEALPRESRVHGPVEKPDNITAAVGRTAEAAPEPMSSSPATLKRKVKTSNASPQKIVDAINKLDRGSCRETRSLMSRGISARRSSSYPTDRVWPKLS